MRALLLVAAGASTVLLSGCGTPTHERFTVLDDGSDRGAVLCVDGVMESYPPQCSASNPTIGGWSWDGLEHELAQGVRWGEFRIVGERHGDVFVLSEPPEGLPPGTP